MDDLPFSEAGLGEGGWDEDRDSHRVPAPRKLASLPVGSALRHRLANPGLGLPSCPQLRSQEREGLSQPLLLQPPASTLPLSEPLGLSLHVGRTELLFSTCAVAIMKLLPDESTREELHQM